MTHRHSHNAQTTGGSQIATPSDPRSPSACANASRNANGKTLHCFVVIKTYMRWPTWRITIRTKNVHAVPQVSRWSNPLIKPSPHAQPAKPPHVPPPARLVMTERAHRRIGRPLSGLASLQAVSERHPGAPSRYMGLRSPAGCHTEALTPPTCGSAAAAQSPRCTHRNSHATPSSRTGWAEILCP